MPRACSIRPPGLLLVETALPGFSPSSVSGSFLGTERGSPAAEGLVCCPRRERSSSLFPKRSCWGNNETFYEKEDLKLVFIKWGLMEANQKHPLEQWQPFKAPLQKR